MKNETVNEYVFASLVLAEARRFRRARQQKMETEGAGEESIISTPLLVEDLHRAIESLEWSRRESLKFLQESGSESQ